ncbi:MAG: hypothetical protein Q9222_007709 [Ikaeria aurantiellina]
MDWFVRKVYSVITLADGEKLTRFQGEMVEENKPRRFHYTQTYDTHEAPPSKVTVYVQVSRDIGNVGTPMYGDDNRVQVLAKVSADISRIPPSDIPRATGADGHVYFRIAFSIEVTHYSAYTTYELIHGGINYGPVTAEYV